ncbi:PTS system mannose/fructose/sorbose family transporter subunit IID [Enterococcus sp. HY326]|uniref:PTS system mannose/fructose/sorbose family transporter subunit IID n=1 Tax=Enterococcus sp. HY326 TaxID=2971265 RepID=UPI00223FB25B|nr:PTS system mannose/fructose/sorbose family transporter subunit IID [Enterococcus sp. HY326]
MNNPNTNGVLTKKDLKKVGNRWFIGVSTFNYETQMAPSVVYALFPALRKIYDNDDDLLESIENHYKYFNTHPWIANIVLGAALAVEDEGKLNSLEAVQDLKVGLMGPLAGIGDTIIWAMLPTILGSIAASMAQEGSPIGVFIWVLIYGLSLFIRPSLYEFGYKQGAKLITQMGSQLSAFTDAISVLGLAVVGAIIPTTIKLSTGFVFKNGDVELELQSMLDQILPALLPVLLVGLIYFLMSKKHIKMTTIILLVIVVALLGAFLGVFTV